MTTVKLVMPGRWEVMMEVGPVHGNARGVAHRLRRLGLTNVEVTGEREVTATLMDR